MTFSIWILGAHLQFEVNTELCASVPFIAGSLEEKVRTDETVLSAMGMYRLGDLTISWANISNKSFYCWFFFVCVWKFDFTDLSL